MNSVLEPTACAANTCECTTASAPVTAAQAAAPAASVTQGPASVQPNASGYTFMPKVDIYEDANALHLEAEMPGVREDQVDVKVDDGVLTIIGRVAPTAYGDYQRVHTEYEVGHYERSFRLGEGIDPAQIQAVLKHGVLHLTLAKREAVKPRRIEVKVGA